MRIAIDIETAPGRGYEDYEDAALDHHRNQITQIAYATSTGEYGAVKTVAELNKKIAEWRPHNPIFVGHNFKFDLKTLIEKGAHLTPDDYHNDTMLQAVANPNKVPDSYLQWYAAERSKLNAILGTDQHRSAGKHSLKVLAPYLLKVAPFWETADHNDSEYAIKDAKYTLALDELQRNLLKELGVLEFYEKKLMRWARMILRAELNGIRIDLDLLAKEHADGIYQAAKAKDTLLELWATPMAEYKEKEARALRAHYTELCNNALVKSKNPAKTIARYDGLFTKALAKLESFNIDSPSQIMWLFRDHYKLDVTTFEGDESTGKSVLEKLGKTDPGAKALLDYRKQNKLNTSFFPTYGEMHWDGKIYTNFNLGNARTGRTTSDNPNLQQVPGHLHKLFIADPGKKLLCYDLSNIEPILIAYLTECPELTHLLLSGGNFHDNNAKVFFNLDIPADEIKTKYPTHRKIAKELGLLLLYGGGKRRIMESAQKYGMAISEYDAQLMFEKFRSTYQTIYNFKRQLDRRMESGETNTNLLGRKYRIENPEDVYMKAFNTMIQGSASDLLLEWGARFLDLTPEAQPLLFIHDEVVMQVPENNAEILASRLVGLLDLFVLNTPFGRIKLKAEGGVSDYWRK